MLINDMCIVIKWSDIISTVSTIATVIAVIIALNANKKAEKQLVLALKMQEQSKNVDLFDKRVELMEKADELSKQITGNDAKMVVRIKILFDGTTSQKVDELLKIKEERSNLYLIKCKMWEEYFKKNNFNKKSDMQDAIKNYENKEIALEKLIEISSRHTLTFGTMENINYGEIVREIDEKSSKINEKLKEIKEYMELFILKSIEPVKSQNREL